VCHASFGMGKVCKQFEPLTTQLWFSTSEFLTNVNTYGEAVMAHASVPFAAKFLFYMTSPFLNINGMRPKRTK